MMKCGRQTWCAKIPEFTYQSRQNNHLQEKKRGSITHTFSWGSFFRCVWIPIQFAFQIYWMRCIHNSCFSLYTKCVIKNCCRSYPLYSLWQRVTEGMSTKYYVSMYVCDTQYNWFIFDKWKFIFHLGGMGTALKCGAIQRIYIQRWCHNEGIFIGYFYWQHGSRHKTFTFIATKNRSSYLFIFSLCAAF